MRSILLVGLLASCTTQAQDSREFYDHVESGTRWQLTIDGGSLVSDAYQGACPAFAPRAAHVPDDGQTACDPGCTCYLAFSYSIYDDGGLGPNDVTQADFEQQCSNGSSLGCVSLDPMAGEVGWCTWLSGTIDPSADRDGDCEYSFTLAETP